MQAEYLFKESLYSLRSNPLRSALSILGVIFGVASVVAMLSVGLGAESEIEALLDSLGSQNIHVLSNDLDHKEWRKVIKSTNGLSYRDAQIAESLFPDMEITTVSVWKSGNSNLKLPEGRIKIYGMSPNYRRNLDLSIAAGRSFTNYEQAHSTPSAVIGGTLAKAWFGENVEDAIGKEFRIDSSWFQVVGVLKGGKSPSVKKKTTKNKADKPKGAKNSAEIRKLKLSNRIILPLTSATKRLGKQEIIAPFERLIIKVPKIYDPIEIKTRLQSQLNRLHRGAKVVTVTAADEVIAQKKSTSRLFSYFLLTIALISLVVGGIGIANVMLAGMVERIREVGLRRAIGAKQKDILWQFLTEALCICLIGGVIGGFGGMAVAGLIGSITGWSVVFPWWGIAIAMIIATMVGIGSGLYPAITASKISPVEALNGRA